MERIDADAIVLAGLVFFVCSLVLLGAWLLLDYFTKD